MQAGKSKTISFPWHILIFYISGLNIWRLFFIFKNDAPDVWWPIWSGLRLDVSMICGVFLISYTPWLLFIITKGNVFRHICKWIHVLLWIFICIVEFASLIIYSEWGATLDSRAISYLSHPAEAWASSKDFLPFWWSFIALVVLVSGIKWLLRLFDAWQKVTMHYWAGVSMAMLIGPLCFLGLRGGWQKLPIVPSDAFYSENMVNNFASTNKVWYFIYSLVKKEEVLISNTPEDIDAFEKSYRIDSCTDDEWKHKLSNKNIVFIITEGWSADMVSYLYGKENITPFFDSLSNISTRCKSAFSTGFRTDQGLMSILSGIPSVQSKNMPNVIDKVSLYPSLAGVFRQAGRSTSFIYGGDLNFSNLFNYLTLQGFDTIISEKDFTRQENSTDWGVPDHIMVQKAAQILDSQNGLFFSTILLMSSHAPFDIPIKNQFSAYSDIPSRYKSSVRYSDESLRLFFNMISTKSWFNNTVFVLTSDHGSTHSGFAAMEDHNRFRIPLIIYSPDKDTAFYNKDIIIPCNHFDLPATMACLATGDSHPFVFGRNIFCKSYDRNAYWNIEETAGVYGIENQSIESVKQHGGRSAGEAVLFLDMIKRWWKSLDYPNSDIK